MLKKIKINFAENPHDYASLHLASQIKMNIDLINKNLLFRQEYGSWPASGEIDIMESRGNENYAKDGVQIGNQQVN